MAYIAAIVFSLILLRGAIAQEFSMDCHEHCKECKDEVPEDCAMNAYLLPDGDICRCCDQCGYKRSFEQSCQDEVEMKKVDDGVFAKVVPVKCEHGYECVSGRCVKSESGFCTIFLNGRQNIYACDNNDHFLPIECSNYHCWCINPITGNPVSKTKVLKPMNAENVSYCYYLMTINGVLDLILPGSKHYSGLYMKRIKNEIDHLDFSQIFPERILQSLDFGKPSKKTSSKTIEKHEKPSSVHMDRNKKKLEPEPEESYTRKAEDVVENDDEMFYKMVIGRNTVIKNNTISQNNIETKKVTKMHDCKKKSTCCVDHTTEQ